MSTILDALIRAVAERRIAPEQAVKVARTQVRKTTDKGEVAQRYILNSSNFYVSNHTINGSKVVFGMMYCALAIEAVKQKFQIDRFLLKNIIFNSPVVISDDREVEVDVEMSALVNDEFEVRCNVSRADSCENQCVAEGRLVTYADGAEPRAPGYNSATNSGEEVYQSMALSGIEHGRDLKALTHWTRANDELKFELAVGQNALREDATLYASPTLLNAAYLASSVFAKISPNKPLIPISIRKLSVLGRLQGTCWGIAHHVSSNKDFFISDVTLYDDAGAAIVTIEGLTGKTVPSANDMLEPHNEASTGHSSKDRQGMLASASGSGGIKENIEVYLQGVVGRHLERKESEIPLEISFMELGVNSALLLKMVREIEEDIEVELYPTVFFEYQTIYAVSEYFFKEFFREFESALTAASESEQSSSAANQPSATSDRSEPKREEVLSNNACASSASSGIAT